MEITLLVLLVAVVFLFIGFWMGRKTQDKIVFTPHVKNDGGQPPLAEYDPFEDAMSDKKMEKTVEG